MKYLLIAIAFLAVSLTDGRNVQKTPEKYVQKKPESEHRLPASPKNVPATEKSDPCDKQQVYQQKQLKIEELDQNEHSLEMSQNENSLEKNQKDEPDTKAPNGSIFGAIRAFQTMVKCLASFHALNTQTAYSEESYEGSLNNKNIKKRFASDYYFDDSIESLEQSTKNYKQRLQGIYMDSSEENCESDQSIGSQELIGVDDLGQCLLEVIAELALFSISQAEDSLLEEYLETFEKQHSDEYNPFNENFPFIEDSETLQEFWDWIAELVEDESSFPDDSK